MGNARGLRRWRLAIEAFVRDGYVNPPKSGKHWVEEPRASFAKLAFVDFELPPREDIPDPINFEE